MACVECAISDESQDSLVLDYEIGARIDRRCQALGLIVRPLITMCVLSPPLIITRSQINDLVSILRTGIKQVRKLAKRALYQEALIMTHRDRMRGPSQGGGKS